MRRVSRVWLSSRLIALGIAGGTYAFCGNGKQYLSLLQHLRRLRHLFCPRSDHLHQLRSQHRYRFALQPYVFQLQGFDSAAAVDSRLLTRTTPLSTEELRPKLSGRTGCSSFHSSLKPLPISAGSVRKAIGVDLCVGRAETGKQTIGTGLDLGSTNCA